VLARDLALASTSTHQNFAAKKSFKCAVMLHTKRKEHCVVRSPYFYPFSIRPADVINRAPIQNLDGLNPSW